MKTVLYSDNDTVKQLVSREIAFEQDGLKWFFLKFTDVCNVVQTSRKSIPSRRTSIAESSFTEFSPLYVFNIFGKIEDEWLRLSNSPRCLQFGQMPSQRKGWLPLCWIRHGWLGPVRDKIINVNDAAIFILCVLLARFVFCVFLFLFVYLYAFSVNKHVQ